MFQEILTYLIVAVALIWAALKIYRRFFKPAKKSGKVDFSKDKIVMAHNCSECSANNCALRDMPKKVIEKNIEQCNSMAVKSERFKS
ncbi:hypothetical protein [uncultured Draconibacterium sp.]|uniref:hypothetical protein n=1 Tax=uncultured Draconibacterium sp. TaxID=1573823 RepID=UPI0025D8A667|nr:hypothetical protein [uncultured Draconibacterium sp.]